MKFLLSWWLVLSAANLCLAQARSPLVTPAEPDTARPPFIRADLNRIEQTGPLDPFFVKLYEQRIQGRHRIHIVHLGDSHIQGDFLTREVRRYLQTEFGNAGRGLIFPYRLAGTNGPRDYAVASPVRWTAGNCVRNRAESAAFGICGYAVESPGLHAEMTVRLRDTTAAYDGFSKIVVFQPNEPGYAAARVYDPATGEEAQMLIEGENFRSFYLNRPVHTAVLGALPVGGAHRPLRIDGLSLENELAGVLYHSIGVNSATAADFAGAERLIQSLTAFYPDLIILSFGTNEAQTAAGTAGITQQLDNLIRQLRLYCPASPILLTTPAESYLRGRSPNPHLAEVSAHIRTYAAANGLPLWDLFRIAGGERSAPAWREAGLLSSDKVHFSVNGYALQGKLLYEGLVQAYNDWVMGR